MIEKKQFLKMLEEAFAREKREQAMKTKNK